MGMLSVLVLLVCVTNLHVGMSIRLQITKGVYKNLVKAKRLQSKMNKVHANVQGEEEEEEEHEEELTKSEKAIGILEKILALKKILILVDVLCLACFCTLIIKQLKKSKLGGSNTGASAPKAKTVLNIKTKKSKKDGEKDSS